MEFKNEKTISKEAKEQIESIGKIWQKHMGESLYGVYVHGSLLLNSSRKKGDEIDMLTIVTRKIERTERLAIAKDIMEAEGKHFPLEIAALCLEDIRPWRYPPKCQFHYNDNRTEEYEKLLSGEMEQSPLVDGDFEDIDIACHVKLVKQSGICVCGEPVEETFPDVPEEDFWCAVGEEIAKFDFCEQDEKYFVQNLMMLGRILSYKKENQVLSRYAGAIWTRSHTPKKYRYILDNAIKVWYSGKEQIAYKREDLEGLKEYLIERIRNE